MGTAADTLEDLITTLRAITVMAAATKGRWREIPTRVWLWPLPGHRQQGRPTVLRLRQRSPLSGLGTAARPLISMLTINNLFPLNLCCN